MCFKTHPKFNYISKTFLKKAKSIIKDKKWILINPNFSNRIENALKTMQKKDIEHIKKKLDIIIPVNCEWKDEYHNQFFDTLVEIFGYQILSLMSFKASFIETQKTKTPDLRGEKNGQTVVVECKNMRNSDWDEKDKRSWIPGIVYSFLSQPHDKYITETNASNPFYTKLKEKIDDGVKQLISSKIENKLLVINFQLDTRFFLHTKTIVEKVLEPLAKELKDKDIFVFWFEQYNTNKVLVNTVQHNLL